MTFQLSEWELISILSMVIASAWAGFGMLLRMLNRQLDIRFQSAESARIDGQAQWTRMFSEMTDQIRKESDGWQRLERDFLVWKGELPIQYVRREDYVRNQTVIEAKLDALALRIENQYLKRNDHV